MFEHRVELKTPDLEGRLGKTRYRLPFVDAHSGAAIGYFVPEGCNSDKEDPDGPLAVTFEMRTAYGSLDDITEFFTPDGAQSLGFFVPETEADLKKYDRFEEMYSQEYFDHILATQPTGRSLAEIMQDLRKMR
jgi:hypothetical protein